MLGCNYLTSVVFGKRGNSALNPVLTFHEVSPFPFQNTGIIVYKVSVPVTFSFIKKVQLKYVCPPPTLLIDQSNYRSKYILVKYKCKISKYLYSRVVL